MGTIARSGRGNPTPPYAHHLVLAVGAVSLIVVGCHAPPSAQPALTATQSARFAKTAESIHHDPVACLRAVKQRCDALAAYRLTFYRQERLGMLQSLGKPETMNVVFRAHPYSVKFTWDDPDSYLAESLYVAGENDNKLIVREKHGILGLPPTIRRINPMDSVTWGQSKRPITDFGLAKLMERTMNTIDDPPADKPARIDDRGVVTIDRTGQEAHYLTITRSVAPGHPHPRQDLWIDAETQLPAGTALYLQDGRLDALYYYADVRPNASISDKDFRPSRPKPTSRPVGGRPAE